VAWWNGIPDEVPALDPGETLTTRFARDNQVWQKSADWCKAVDGAGLAGGMCVI